LVEKFDKLAIEHFRSFHFRLAKALLSTVKKPMPFFISGPYSGEEVAGEGDNPTKNP